MACIHKDILNRIVLQLSFTKIELINNHSKYLPAAVSDIMFDKELTSKESSFNRIRAMFCDTSRQEYPETEKGQHVNFILPGNS